MEVKKITVKELHLAVEQDIAEMVQEVVEAMNNAKAGSIIADSEEPVRVTGRVYWSSQAGMFAPADGWLGIAQSRYSPGLREMVCRLSLNEAFVPAADNLKRLVQVTVSSSAVRCIVETQGEGI